MSDYIVKILQNQEYFFRQRPRTLSVPKNPSHVPCFPVPEKFSRKFAGIS
jgi:hypothetical protein